MESLKEYADELENEMIGKTNNPDLVAQTGMDEDAFYDEMMKGLKSGGMSYDEYRKRSKQDIVDLQKRIDENNNIRGIRARQTQNH